MSRKISLSLLLVAMLVIVGVVSAAGTLNPNQAVNGCFAFISPTTVNEGVSIPVSFECDGVPVDNNVFGFQMGTSLPAQGLAGGDYASPAPTDYTAGEFTSAATGGAAGTLIGENSLGLYGVSRKTTNVVTTTDFTLGSYTLIADTDLTSADGSIAVTFEDSAFRLSDNLGASLPNWLRTINDDSVAINDIDLAWLNGNATVQSDSNALTLINDVDLNLGGKHYSSPSVGSYQIVFDMEPAYAYIEDASGAVVVNGDFVTHAPVAQNSDDTLNIAVTADMWGHLDCSSPVVDLDDAGAAEDVDGFVGTSGVVTLKAGDVTDYGTISNTDAVAIGLDFGDSGGDINASTENDINLDDTVNIFDLVHVGRNFNATTSACS